MAIEIPTPRVQAYQVKGLVRIPNHEIPNAAIGVVYGLTAGSDEAARREYVSMCLMAANLGTAQARRMGRNAPRLTPRDVHVQEVLRRPDWEQVAACAVAVWLAEASRR